MNVCTLRNWGGAVAVSLPKKLLAALGLGAGAEVQVRLKEGAIVLAPVRKRHGLARLEKEQRRLEQSLGGPLVDKGWLDSPARGRESL
jgi:antitoxin component of MazEF toxin-antitoxin module